MTSTDGPGCDTCWRPVAPADVQTWETVRGLVLVLCPVCAAHLLDGVA